MEPEEQVTVSGSPMADRRAVIRNTILRVVIWMICSGIFSGISSITESPEAGEETAGHTAVSAAMAEETSGRRGRICGRRLRSALMRRHSDATR